jgi:hypothetical protein
MIDLGRPFRAPYHPARAFFLHKGLLGLLAFDAWAEMLEHAGRYGAGGFNVAHFAWIDRLIPLPTPGLYAGSMALLGLLALGMLLAGAPRWGKAALATLYTASWLISLHDSYQHHYFLSYALAWLVFVPDVKLRELGTTDAQPVGGFGLPMTAITCAIVYAFTGVAKSEADWRSGAVLKRLSHSRPPGSDHPGVLDPARDLLMDLGLSSATSWWCIALSVIALQWVVAVGYLASLERDARPTRPRAWLASLALLGAWSFHAFAELGDMFDIGWFSFYMLWLALVLLAPAAWLGELGASLARAQAAIEARMPGAQVPAWLAGGLAMLGALALCLAGAALDVPGTLAAGCLAGALVVGIALWLQARQRGHGLLRVTMAALLCASAMYGSIAWSTARFDYYRRAAGEFLRMGQLESALALYIKAERYAPSGESRRHKIDEIRSKLRKQQSSAP